jgi:hypothetical protein
VSAPQSAAPVATLVLTDTAVKLRVIALPGPDDGGGVWRFYDKDAQVVCYVYGSAGGVAPAGLGGSQDVKVSYSGLSCLPVSQTSLGK